ncbi:MAG: adenylyltransferase/cytidyltransferase family protein [Candidatus Paceibacteria bacterium]
MTYGHVHGRFQPFHNGHAKYLRWAIENSDRLIIGITNADPSHVKKEDADPGRHKPENNPYNYINRQKMIESFTKENVDIPTEVAPFPVNRPGLWGAYLPESTTHFVRVLEEWHQKKVNRLIKHGKNTRTTSAERQVSGKEVRCRMREGTRAWRQLVPESVVRVIEELDIILPK